MGCQQSHSHVDAASRSKFNDLNEQVHPINGGFAGKPSQPDHHDAEAETKKAVRKSLNYLGFGRVDGDSSEQPLTPEQRSIIKETWANNLSLDLTDVGRKVFLHIFELRPSVKYLFSFRNLDDDELERHPLFLENVRRFMMTVDLVVEEVDDLSSAPAGSPALTLLGRKHVTMEGFIGNYFQVFTQGAMTVCLQELGPLCTPEMSDAWRTLFEYIIKQLIDGYNLEKEGC